MTVKEGESQCRLRVSPYSLLVFDPKLPSLFPAVLEGDAILFQSQVYGCAVTPKCLVSTV